MFLLFSQEATYIKTILNLFTKISLITNQKKQTKMNKTELKQLNDLLEKNNELIFLGENDFSMNQITNFDDLYEELIDSNYFQIEIIYYNKAIKYLSENDQSLCKSLELADDFGYELKHLNSELLASLLASRNAEDSFYNLKNEINLILNK